jgi:hypothetical protein
MDGFATCFFAAYGIEAGLHFVNGFPPKIVQIIPAAWEGLFFFFLNYVALLWIVMIFAGLTACGGGLARAIAIDVFLLRQSRVREVVRSFPKKRSTQNAAAIGAVGLAMYWLLETSIPVEGQCQQLDKALLFKILLACGGAGIGLWGKYHAVPPRSI